MTKKSEKYHLQFIKLLDDMKAVNNNQRRQNKFLFSLGLREGLKKRGEGSATGDFPLRKKKKKKRQAGAELGQAQPKLGLDFTLLYLN